VKARTIMSTSDRIGPPDVAERMRLYRRRRRRGMQYVRIALHVTEVDTLIHMGLLTEEQRQDADALQTAILAIVYRALEAAELSTSDARQRG
jgi:hypothetical protein